MFSTSEQQKHHVTFVQKLTDATDITVQRILWFRFMKVSKVFSYVASTYDVQNDTTNIGPA